MKEEKTPEMDKLIKKTKRVIIKLFSNNALGNIDEAIKFLKQGEELIGKFRGNLPRELERSHCLLLAQKANIPIGQGNLQRGFEVAKELLFVAEKYGNNWGISEAYLQLGLYYQYSNDLDQALAHFDRAIKIKETLLNDTGEFVILANIFNSAIPTAIRKNDFDRAKRYFNRLEEIYNTKPKDLAITQCYKLNKASLLKSSVRSRDRVKAEELLKEMIQDKLITTVIYQFEALRLLCELLLVELRLTGNIDVINEIASWIPNMIELAEQRRSRSYLIEVYTLQGKLALLTFDFKKSQRLLTQARRIAERYGYVWGANEILRLQEDLKKQASTWERLRKKNATISERMELARLNDHLNDEFRNRMMRMERVTEKEITVYKDLKTCLVCKGNVGGFNIYMCPECNSIYCKACAEAVVEIENACWTCESPIDEARPSKPFEQQKEEISIETKDGKKSVEKDLPKKVKNDEKRRKLR